MSLVPQCLGVLGALVCLGALDVLVILQDQLDTSVELTQQMQTINLIDATGESARRISSLASCIVTGWLAGWFTYGGSHISSPARLPASSQWGLERIMGVPFLSF